MANENLNGLFLVIRLLSLTSGRSLQNFTALFGTNRSHMVHLLTVASFSKCEVQLSGVERKRTNCTAAWADRRRSHNLRGTRDLSPPRKFLRMMTLPALEKSFIRYLGRRHRSFNYWTSRRTSNLVFMVSYTHFSVSNHVFRFQRV